MKNIKPITILNEDIALHKEFVGSIIRCIEKYLDSLSMVKGLLARKSYAALKAVRPGYIEHISNIVLKEYIQEFSPIHEEFRNAQHLPAETIVPLRLYMHEHYDQAEAIFWRVAERFASKYRKSIIGKTYQLLRPTISSHLPAVLKVVCDEIDTFTVFDEP